MKKKILISVFLILAAMFYSFKEISSLNKNTSMKTESDDPQDQFLLGAMHDYRDSVYTYLSDTLNFNIWHKYTVPNGWGWPILGSNITLPADVLDTPVYRYSADIRERLSVNKSKNLMTLLDRPKFEYLAFGQRSDYQCERSENVDSDYWFYTYYNSTDNGISITDIQDFTYGSGEYVKQCLYDSSNPGSNAQMLFDSLKGNMEQTNTFWPVTWLGDSHEPWYILPRIRIDSVFANNPENQGVDVCKLIIKNRDGDSLTQVIKVKNFKSSDTSRYLGNYLEQYFSRSGAEITNLIIDSLTWFNNNPDISFGDTQCQVDFKVFWYDNCNMWIDRIRVENLPAHEMLTLNLPKIEEWIRAEVEDIVMAEINNGNESPYKFYIEEFEMNHLPCIGYLNKKIIEYSGGRLSLMVNYNHDLVKAFIPNSWDKLFSPAQVKKYLIDSAGIREIFTECYNLEGWRKYEHPGNRESYVPTTLYDGDEYQHDQGLLVYKKSPSAYDDWIQEHFDNYSILGLNLKHIFQFSDTVSKIGNVPFMNLAQVHLWSGTGHMLKEPTNEEIALINNLAISYGAKGILYFAWGSHKNNFDSSGIPQGYSRGLTNPDDSPRRLNVYGQNKWELIKSLDKKYKEWGPYLMSFDTNRHSYIFRLTRNDLISETFFTDVISYKPDPSNYSIPLMTPESVSQRYLQVGIFNNPDESFSKYFMIINRRCSPYDSTHQEVENGGRYIKIRLDTGSVFAGFNNWKIIDLAENSTVITFDKRITGLLNLKWFLPGEGKLYKLAPVMQEGGILVANEECSGSFNCKDEVYNNGYDIKINPATIISVLHYRNSLSQ